MQFAKKSKDYRKILSPVASLYCALGRQLPLNASMFNLIVLGIRNWNADASRICASTLYTHCRAMVDIGYTTETSEFDNSDRIKNLGDSTPVPLSKIAEEVFPYIYNAYALYFKYLPSDDIRSSGGKALNNDPNPLHDQPFVPGNKISSAAMKEAIEKLPKLDDSALRGVRKLEGATSPPILLPHLPARLTSACHALYNVEWSNPNVTLSAESTDRTANILLDPIAGVYICRLCGLFAGIDVHAVEVPSKFYNVNVRKLHTNFSNARNLKAKHVPAFPDENASFIDAGDTDDSAPKELKSDEKEVVWDGNARQHGVHSSRFLSEHCSKMFGMLVKMTFDRRWRVSLEVTKILSASGLSRILSYTAPSGCPSNGFLNQILGDASFANPVSSPLIQRARQKFPRAVVPDSPSSDGASVFAYSIQIVTSCLEHVRCLYDPSTYVQEKQVREDETLRDVLQLSRMAGSSRSSSSVVHSASNSLEQQIQHRAAMLVSAARAALFVGRAFVGWEHKVLPWAQDADEECDAFIGTVEQVAQAGGPFVDLHRRRFCSVHKWLKSILRKLQKGIVCLLLEHWAQSSASVHDGIGANARKVLVEALVWSLSYEDYKYLQERLHKSPDFVFSYDNVTGHLQSCLYAIAHSITQLGKKDVDHVVRSIATRNAVIGQLAQNTAMLGVCLSTSQQQTSVYMRLTAIQLAASTPTSYVLNWLVVHWLARYPKMLSNFPLKMIWDASADITFVSRRYLVFSQDKRSLMPKSAANLCRNIVSFFKVIRAGTEQLPKLAGQATEEHPGMASLLWNGDAGVMRNNSNPHLRNNVANMLNESHVECLPWEWDGQSGETVDEAKYCLKISAFTWIGDHLGHLTGVDVPPATFITEGTNASEQTIDNLFDNHTNVPSQDASVDGAKNSNPFVDVVNELGIHMGTDGLTMMQLCELLYPPMFEVLWEITNDPDDVNNPGNNPGISQVMIESLLQLSLSSNIVVRGCIYELLQQLKMCRPYASMCLSKTLKFLQSVALEQLKVLKGGLRKEESKLYLHLVDMFPKLKGYDILSPAL